MNLSEFYSENSIRKKSPEADYGVWWYDTQPFPPHRVTYIRDTGEVYAVALDNSREVEILGLVPPDVDLNVYYRTLDRILDGWSEECGRCGSLDWVRERLVAA